MSTAFIGTVPSLYPVCLPIEDLAKRYEVLSCLSSSLVSQSPDDLLCNLATLVRPLMDFDLLDLVVFKEGTSEILWHSIGTGQLPPQDVPMEKTTYWWAYQQKQPLFICDWEQDERFSERREALKHLGFEYRSLCRLPLYTAGISIGVLSFASFRPHFYSDEEIRFLSLAAGQISLAISGFLHNARTQRAELELEAKNAQLRLLVDLTTKVAGLCLEDLLRSAAAGVSRVVRSDFLMVGLFDPVSGEFLADDVCLPDDARYDMHFRQSLRHQICQQLLPAEPSFFPSETAGSTNAGAAQILARFGTSYVLPIAVQSQIQGFLAIAKQEQVAYTPKEVEFLTLVSNQLAIAIRRAVEGRERNKSRAEHHTEKLYVEDRTRSDVKFPEIVGKSSALQEVLRQVEIVAPANCSVLIGGETGTGKELIARAIHNLSPRRDRPFVKVNCAAIPLGLLESELFGHEKGAFTGAIARKAGRFEAAHGGTLFLDEIGDIPLELQPKLLRVLQEGEFERLGSTRTQCVDVRVIAATHRDLAQMIKDGEFRADLFYRLHVFPITLPALRDRREDIPALTRHYVDIYAGRMNRHIGIIPSHAMEVLVRYSWPGNVRELQNFIERAVILSPGNVFRAPLSQLMECAGQSLGASVSTLEETEREHILRALRESNWVIGGSNGAAVRLGMKRTTLAYRINKLRIPCRPA